jgi:SAM-dependent methyltransferase
VRISRAVPTASRIAHAGLAFANPMSGPAIDEAIAALPLPAEPRVLDIGCGSGEILLRVLRTHNGSHGLGIDLDPDAIAEARQRAGALPARFEVRDAATLEGPFDAVISVAASHAHGGFPLALKALRRLGPVVLYGEGFWKRSPSRQFLAALRERRPRSSRTLSAFRTRSPTRALSFWAAGWRIRLTGRTTRRRSPRTPSATGPRRPSRTHNGSATGARCRAGPTRSVSRRSYYAPELRRPRPGSRLRRSPAPAR